MILKIFDFSQAFSENNITIFIVGYTVVFAALVLLYFVFFSISKLLNVKRRRDLFKKGKIKSVDEHVEDISGEVNAAISMALHLHFNEAHDDESYISTIKRVSRIYSPWSSKIYNVRNSFNRL
jgi:Na+-transporting methylmalonyl-CoA/oxaloacetate decarboxylase gamma subunit